MLAGWPMSWAQTIGGSSTPLPSLECIFHPPFLHSAISRMQAWKNNVKKESKKRYLYSKFSPRVYDKGVANFALWPCAEDFVILPIYLYTHVYISISMYLYIYISVCIPNRQWDFFYIANKYYFFPPPTLSLHTHIPTLSLLLFPSNHPCPWLHSLCPPFWSLLSHPWKKVWKESHTWALREGEREVVPGSSVCVKQ